MSGILLTGDVRISRFRDRHKDLLVPFFFMEGNLVYCNDNSGFMQPLNISYNPEDWRRLIDSSMKSLKDILLYDLLNFQFQSTWKKLIKIWNSYWDISTRINVTDNFVEICFTLARTAGG